MRCLECGSEALTERPERTAQGYRRFRCRTCGKQFNERSGTLLNPSAAERSGMRGLVEGQKVFYEVEADRRTGKESTANLKAA